MTSPKKFANIPSQVELLIQLVLMLPTPFFFCYLSGYPFKNSLSEILIDIGVTYLTLIIFIPVMLLSMAILKLIFYGSIMGTKRKVSLKTKNILTFIFIILAIPPASMVQAESFLWLTGRENGADIVELLTNAGFMFLSGLIGFIYSLKGLKEKIALIEEKEKCKV